MNLFRQWGAVIILALMFIGSWCGQLITQMQSEVVFQWSDFWAATFENWQSEFLQLAFQCVLVASFLQSKLFRADYSADKEDVERIIDEVRASRNPR